LDLGAVESYLVKARLAEILLQGGEGVQRYAFSLNIRDALRCSLL
jgi:hypothetical protein